MKLFSPLIKLSLSSLALTLACPSSADTVFGIYAGAGAWQTEYSGEAGDPATSTDDLGMEDNNNHFYYIAVEHPVPLVPNLKLQHNKISSKQTGTLNNNFSIGDITYPIGAQVATDFDLSYTDGVLYYELLDNWVNLDLGITLRKYDGYLQANSTALNVSDRVDIDAAVPLLYGKAEFKLPLTGFAAGIEGNYIGYSGNNLLDYSAKITYLFDSALDLGLEIGYRMVSVTIEDEDDVNTNLDLKGPYAAAVFHF